MQKKNQLRTIKIVGIVIFNLVCLFSVIYVIVVSAERKQAIGEEAEVRVIKEFEKPDQPSLRGATPTLSEAKGRGSDEATPKREIASPLTSTMSMARNDGSSSFLIDDFAGGEITNRVGSRANVYVRAPSRIMISRREDIVNGARKKVLMLKYDKKNTGGPNGMGGWCGYYTLIKNEKTGQYFDGTGYKELTLWVRGEKGDENFMVGLADEHWDKIGDSLKAEEVGVYLEKGKLTTQWQKVRVPIEVFFLDHANLSAISINFEADCFPEGAGAGVVYIADIALEK